MKTLTQSTNTDLSYDTGLELANLYHLHYHHAGKPSFCTLFFCQLAVNKLDQDGLNTTLIDIYLPRNADSKFFQSFQVCIYAYPR